VWYADKVGPVKIETLRNRNTGQRNVLTLKSYQPGR
jgi:hypothetical protein